MSRIVLNASAHVGGILGPGVQEDARLARADLGVRAKAPAGHDRRTQSGQLGSSCPWVPSSPKR